MAENPCKRLHSELTPEKVSKPNMDVSVLKSLMREVLAETGLDTLKDDLQTMQTDINSIKDSVEFAHQTSQNAKSQADENKLLIVKMAGEMDLLKTQLKSERDARLKLETYSRRSNLRFFGFTESLNEKDSDCERFVRDLWSNKLGITDNISIERCHRLGPRPKSGDTRSRPIIVKFSFYKERDRIWKSRKNLAGTKIFMKEDYPPEIEKRVDRMMPIFLAARKNSQFSNVKLIVDKLYISGTMYTVETIDRLPAPLQPESLAMRTDGNITWFFRKDSHLSNHYMCKITDTDGKNYSSVEQYYMAQRALFFKDEQSYETIMTMDDPAAIKRVRLRNFDPRAWEKQNRRIMKAGLQMKYGQNPDLCDKLLQTKNTVLCEANPRDDYWGIGMSMHHPDAADVTKWGQNHLGKLLQEVRELCKSK